VLTRVWCANIHLYLACHAGLAKKLWQQLGSRNRESFQAIINKMYDILKMDVPGCEYKVAKVSTTLVAQLKVWREADDRNESAAADFFKYWRGETGKRAHTQKHK
jgi:hypothetical protein